MENKRDVYWHEIEDRSLKGNLKDKVVIITGGSKGIGRAIARRFLDNGAEVVIVSRETGEKVAEELGECCHFKPCDVRDNNRVKEVVEETVTEFGKLDILVNSAGFAWLTPIKEETEEFFDKIMDTNFKGVRNFIAASAEHLEETGGDIVSLGSIWGLPGTNLPGDSTYSAGDAAIIKYSEVAAEEFENVDVNTISPALVDTSMNDDMSEEAIQEFVEKYKTRDSMFHPNDIAEVAEFLVKNDTDQKNIVIDAGYTQ